MSNRLIRTGPRRCSYLTWMTWLKRIRTMLHYHWGPNKWGSVEKWHLNQQLESKKKGTFSATLDFCHLNTDTLDYQSVSNKFWMINIQISYRIRREDCSVGKRAAISVVSVLPTSRKSPDVRSLSPSGSVHKSSRRLFPTLSPPLKTPVDAKGAHFSSSCILDATGSTSLTLLPVWITVLHRLWFKKKDTRN